MANGVEIWPAVVTWPTSDGSLTEWMSAITDSTSV